MLTEEDILEQLHLQDLSAEEKAGLLDQISTIMAAKLTEACAEQFTELELSRVEYMISQGDDKALEEEIRSHIADPDALFAKVAQDTLTEIQENIKALA